MKDNNFPRNVYISPGKIKTNNGKTYDTVLVENEDDLLQAAKAGYVDSYFDALNKVKKEKFKKAPVIEEDDDF